MKCWWGGGGPPSPTQPSPAPHQHPVGQKLAAWLDLLSRSRCRRSQARQKGGRDSCSSPLTPPQASATRGEPGRPREQIAMGGSPSTKDKTGLRSLSLWVGRAGEDECELRLFPHRFPHSHTNTSGLGIGTEGQLPQSKQAFVEALSWTTLRASLARNSASHLRWLTLRHWGGRR